MVRSESWRVERKSWRVERESWRVERESWSVERRGSVERLASGKKYCRTLLCVMEVVN